MTPEELLLSTCIHHGVRNGWDELRFITDFSVLLNTHKQLNWDEMIVTAEKIGIRRAFLVGISLSNLLFGIIIPAQLNEYIAKDKQVDSIKFRIYHELFKVHNLKRLYSIKFIKILLREQYSTKIILCGIC